MIGSVLQTCRPKQWIKNVIIFAAYVFSLGERDLILENELHLLVLVMQAFIAFSLLSSSIYVLNDIQDREADRNHSRKRNRPIASGRLSVPVAYGSVVMLLVVALILSISISIAFTIIGLTYFIIFAFYSFGLKRIVVLDVLLIAFGFILRAVAGGLAIDVKISGWLIICTLFLALFLGFAKRRSELSNLGDKAVEHRMSLRNYNLQQLDAYLIICSCLSIIAYTMYTVSDWSMAQVGYDGILTLPFVILGLFRYLYLVYKKEEGGDPTHLLLKDIPLLLVVITWGGTWLYLKGVSPQLLNGIIVL